MRRAALTRVELAHFRHPRQGTLLVFAMIALLVASMIGASLLRTAVMSLRQLHREQQRIQAGWLADAGCQRAAWRIRTDPEYLGEEWNVPAEQLQSSSGGLVRIDVVPDRQDQSWTVSVVAEFPRDAVQQSRISRKITVTKPKREAT